MELRGRSVLVTGATGGLGQAVARRLAAEGCSLTLSGRRRDAVDSLAAELDASAVVADLTSSEELRSLGELDVDLLVTAAGVGGLGELTDFSVDELDRVLQVNLRAPVVLARLLGERMLARGFGHIVFLSALAGKAAAPAASMFNASKFGLRGLALGLRQDWGPRGVGVSCVNPGHVEKRVENNGAALPAGFRPRLPEDVAAAVVKAVKHDRAEVDVADPVKRAGVVLGQLAPQTAARLSRFVVGEAR